MIFCLWSSTHITYLPTHQLVSLYTCWCFEGSPIQLALTYKVGLTLHPTRAEMAKLRSLSWEWHFQTNPHTTTSLINALSKWMTLFVFLFSPQETDLKWKGNWKVMALKGPSYECWNHGWILKEGVHNNRIQPCILPSFPTTMSSDPWMSLGFPLKLSTLLIETEPPARRNPV